MRWKGQIQPQYSQTYYFVARTNDGAKLTVNGQVIIDNWISQGTTDQTGAIDLQGGVLYDLRMDYGQTGGGAEAHLSWNSADQVSQIIPINRLYPSATGSGGAAPPSITRSTSFSRRSRIISGSVSGSSSFGKIRVAPSRGDRKSVG